MVGQFVILTEKKSRQDCRQSRNLVKWTLEVGAPHPESLITGKTSSGSLATLFTDSKEA